MRADDLDKLGPSYHSGSVGVKGVLLMCQACFDGRHCWHTQQRVPQRTAGQAGNGIQTVKPRNKRAPGRTSLLAANLASPRHVLGHLGHKLLGRIESLNVP